MPTEPQTAQQINSPQIGYAEPQPFPHTRIAELEQTVSRLRVELDRALAELNKFHKAMEREKSPKWSEQLKVLADRLVTNMHAQAPALSDLEYAARELRYMADCFTLKANFVPTDLKIKELESERDALRQELEKLRVKP